MRMKRRGPGRPRELVAKRKVLITLEEHLLDFVKRYQDQQGLPSRSAAIRRLLGELSLRGVDSIVVEKK
jgi:hypothetical protein